MGDMFLRCSACGKQFVWTTEEQLEAPLIEYKGEVEGAMVEMLEVEPHCPACRGTKRFQA